MFIEDAIKFVTTFFQPIAHSAPHIYISALPMSPSGSLIAEMYSGHITGVVSLERGKQLQWPSINSVLQGHAEGVTSVAFSPDGKYIVSGSEDKNIRMWDAQTGKLVAAPFEGHTGSVTSVAFSPDGNYIVSGSSDSTIRMWDAQTGRLVSDPFEGHTTTVTSVAFSPDGKYIVSGLGNKTIRMWDARMEQLVSDPSEGHTNSFTSVAFSPAEKCTVLELYDDIMQISNVNPHINSLFFIYFISVLHFLYFLLVFSILNQSCLTFDGWLCTHTGDLLLWIPPWYQSGLQWHPRNPLVIGTHIATLSFDKFAFGKDWCLCKTGA